MSKGDIARIDALVVSVSTPWHKTNRAEFMRALVVEQLGYVDRGELILVIDSPPTKRGGAR